MKDEKKLQDEELKTISVGADKDDRTTQICSHCHERFNRHYASHRETGSGCDKSTEYQCPYCGTWQRKGY